QFAEAWNNRGSLLRDTGKLDEAMTNFRRALALEPGNADTLANSASGLQMQKRFDEALNQFRRLELVAPEHKYLLSGLLVSASALCNWKLVEDLEDRLKSEVLNGKSIVPPFSLLGAFDDPALHLAAAKHYLPDFIGHPQASPAPRPAAHDRIRLAY